MDKSARKVLMFTESFYPQDIRVRYEANSLLKTGYQVSVVSLQMRKTDPRLEDA